MLYLTVYDGDEKDEDEEDDDDMLQ